MTARIARAQEVPWNPYGVDVFRDGPGIKVYDTGLVFHPGVTVEGGYDTNVFYLPSHEVGSALLRIRLHLDLGPGPRVDDGTPTADPKVDFRIATQVEYREYPNASYDVRAQRSINALVSGYVTLFPKGRASLRLDEDYIHSVDPRNADGPANFAREYNRVGASVVGRPGTGRLELGVGDLFTIQHYDDSDVSFGNNIQNDARIFGRFRILPRTILSLTGHIGYIKYATNPQLETLPLRILLQLDSPIARWLEGTVAIGYGNSLALHASRFSSAISQEELRFLLPLGIRISVGHRRDFYDSLFAADYVDDALYLNYTQPFLQRLRFFVEGGVRFRHYDDLVAATTLGYAGYSSSTRDDIVIDAHAGLSVLARRWLVVGVTYNFNDDHTDFAFLYTTGFVQNARYLKHSVLGQVDIAY